MHNLDFLEHYTFSFLTTYNRQALKLSDVQRLKAKVSSDPVRVRNFARLSRRRASTYEPTVAHYEELNNTQKTTKTRFKNKNYNLKFL